MFSCPLHNWSSHDFPCPACHVTITTTSTSNTTPVTELTNSAIAVEVPANAKEFRNHGTYISYEYDVFEGDIGCRQGWIDCLDLPAGQWELIGLAKDLTEDQWKGIIERWDSGKYNDYMRHLACVDTATESGHSLLAKYKLNKETSVILKLKV